MKQSVMIILIIMFFSVIISCDNFVENDTTIRKAKTLSFKKISTSNNKISIIANAEWYNGCGSFSHYNVEENNNDISIIVYGQQPTNATCTQALISFEAPVEIFTDRSGEYNLHFWQSDSTSIDTTITI